MRANFGVTLPERSVEAGREFGAVTQHGHGVSQLMMPECAFNGAHPAVHHVRRGNYVCSFQRKSSIFGQTSSMHQISIYGMGKNEDVRPLWVQSQALELKQWQAVWAKRSSNRKTASKICFLRLAMETPLFQLRYRFNSGASLWIIRLTCFGVGYANVCQSGYTGVVIDHSFRAQNTWEKKPQWIHHVLLKFSIGQWYTYTCMYKRLVFHS